MILQTENTLHHRNYYIGQQSFYSKEIISQYINYSTEQKIIQKDRNHSAERHPFTAQKSFC